VLANVSGSVRRDGWPRAWPRARRDDLDLDEAFEALDDGDHRARYRPAHRRAVLG
jgi:hypothetical protein